MVPSTALLAILVATSGPGAAGQAGLPGSDGRRAGSFRAEFDAHVLSGIDTLMTAWHAAWREDRAADLSTLYGDRSLLILPDGVPLLGPREVGARVEQLLPGVGDLRASMQDYDASERLAYVSGRYELVLAPSGDGSGPKAAGRHVTVFMRGPDGWRIRTQVFFHHGSGPTLPDDGRVGGPVDASHGLEGIRERGRRQEYYDRTFDEVSRAVSEIGRAWRAKALYEASRFYTPDARLWTHDGKALSGASEIRRWLARRLTATGEVRIALLDFEASGSLAVAHGRYLLEGTGGGGGGTALGPYVLVFDVRNEPRIRAHVMGLDPG